MCTTSNALQSKRVRVSQRYLCARLNRLCARHWLRAEKYRIFLRTIMHNSTCTHHSTQTHTRTHECFGRAAQWTVCNSARRENRRLDINQTDSVFCAVFNRTHNFTITNWFWFSDNVYCLWRRSPNTLIDTNQSEQHKTETHTTAESACCVCSLFFVRRLGGVCFWACKTRKAIIQLLLSVPEQRQANANARAALASTIFAST